MSLDFWLEEVKPTEVFSGNITHNLARMAEEAGVYKALWHPEQISAAKASDIIECLESGLAKLKADPAHFEQFNSPNGWGLYKNFVPFVEGVLAACKEHPDASIRVSI